MNRSLVILAVIVASSVSPLLADEKADSSKASATGNDEKKEIPLSPEAIMEKQFEGKATVELHHELLLGEVHAVADEARPPRSVVHQCDDPRPAVLTDEPRRFFVRHSHESVSLHG